MGFRVNIQKTLKATLSLYLNIIRKPDFQRRLKLLAFYYIAYYVGSKLHRKRLSTLRRWGPSSPTIVRFTANTLQWTSYWGVGTLALSMFSGVETSAFLSKIFGVGGIAFGFAAQQTVSNLISGLMLLLSRPFVIGDHIHAAGVSGWVLEIGLLHTYVNTDDHVRVMLPNSKVINSNIVNDTQLAAREINVCVTVSDKEDINATRAILIKAAKEVDARVGVMIARLRPEESKRQADGKETRCNSEQWRHAGVEGRGRPLTKMKPASVVLADMMPKEKVVKWQVNIWAPSTELHTVKDMVLQTVLEALNQKHVKCS